MITCNPDILSMFFLGCIVDSDIWFLGEHQYIYQVWVISKKMSTVFMINCLKKNHLIFDQNILLTLIYCIFCIFFAHDDTRCCFPVFALEFQNNDQKLVPGHRFVFLVMRHWHKISIPDSKVNDLKVNFALTQTLFTICSCKTTRIHNFPQGVIWPSLSPCPVINPILLTHCFTYCTKVC